VNILCSCKAFFSVWLSKHFGDLDFIDIHQDNQVTILEHLQAIDQVTEQLLENASRRMKIDE